MIIAHSPRRVVTRVRNSQWSRSRYGCSDRSESETEVRLAEACPCAIASNSCSRNISMVAILVFPAIGSLQKHHQFRRSGDAQFRRRV